MFGTPASFTLCSICRTILNVNATSANYIIAIALLIGMPFFVVFGALSDRSGASGSLWPGCLLAIADVSSDLSRDAVGRGFERRDRRLAEESGDRAIALTPHDTATNGAARSRAERFLSYTSFGDFISNPVAWKLILLVFIQVVWVTMVYGPIAAYLVEAFPAKIRYTALSLPYHIGNGVFGGLLPLIGVSIIAQTGNIYAGLYYPMIIAAITVVVGSIFLKKHTGIRYGTR